MEYEIQYETLIEYMNCSMYGIEQIEKYGMINMNMPIAMSIVFGIACERRDVDTINKLMSLSQQKKYSINIHHENEYAFRKICDARNIKLLECFIKYCDSINNIIDVYAEQGIGVIEACSIDDIDDDYLEFIEHIIKYVERKYQYSNMIKIYELIVCGACKHSNVKLLKYIFEYCDEMKRIIDIHKNDENIFITAIKSYNNYNDSYSGCCNKVIELLFEYANKHNSKINIHAQNDRAFTESCYRGNYKFIKYLIEEGDRSGQKFDIHMNDETPFCNALHGEHYEIVKYLIEYEELHNNKINIHTQNEYAICHSNDIFYSDGRNNYSKIQQYIIYLSKHNYNKFNINCETINYSRMKYLKINYKKLQVIKDIILPPLKCTHDIKYKHFLNNNIVCSVCMPQSMEYNMVYGISNNMKCFASTVFDINYSFSITHIIDTDFEYE